MASTPRKLTLAMLLLFQLNTALAQLPHGYQLIEGELNSGSAQMDDKRYYTSLPVPMQRGDKSYVVYESKDFITALVLMDDQGHKIQKQDQPLFFETKGSEIEIPFAATVESSITYILTTGKPEATGKFKVHVFYYHAAQEQISSESSFCDKLLYITTHASTSYEFLKKPYRADGFEKFFDTWLLLDPAGVNDIYSGYGRAWYGLSYSDSEDRDAVLKQFDELEATLAECLTGHTKKVYLKEDLSEHNQKYFVREVDFIMEGTHEKDLNSHDKVKYTVNMKINKTTPDDESFQIWLHVQ